METSTNKQSYSTVHGHKNHPSIHVHTTGKEERGAPVILYIYVYVKIFYE